MIIRNDCFKTELGRRMRFLAADARTNTAWIYDLDNHLALPERILLTELQASELSGRIKIIQVKNAIPANQGSEKARKRRDLAWNRIEPLLQDNAIFDADYRGSMIKDKAKELGCSPQTLLKDLRRYWHGGQTKDALLGNFHKSGTSTKVSSAKRGRKPIHSEYSNYAIAEKDIHNFKKVVKSHYLSSAVPSLAQTYEKMIANYYTYLDGNNQSYVLPLGERPTLKQFTYQVNKLFSPEEVIRKRLGNSEFERNHRAKLGSIMQDCLGIGHIYEIDATIADVFLVSSKDRSRIIGKPTLYLIADRQSRLIVGHYVGLEAASWPAAMQAIISIASDKAALCSKYDIEYRPEDWPAEGIFPENFYGDRGEMLSKTSSQLCSGLAINVINAPSLRPDRKGTVENSFRCIHQRMADKVPGYEPPANFNKRRAKKYHLDACLTLDEFEALLIRTIITHNRKIMQNYPLSAELISKGFEPSPRNIWAHEVTQRVGALVRYPEEFVRQQLLPRDTATVTQKGILFNGCYYTCREAVQQNWFVRAGISGNYKINVAYDRRLVNSIYLIDLKDPSNLISATLLEKSHDYMNLSFDEVKVIQLSLKKMQADAEHQRLEENVRYINDTTPLIQNAQAETKKSSQGKSRYSRKVDIKEDRESERKTRRTSEVTPMSRSKNNGPYSSTVVPLAKSSFNQPQPEQIPSNGTSLKEKLKLKRKDALNG